MAFMCPGYISGTRGSHTSKMVSRPSSWLWWEAVAFPDNKPHRPSPPNPARTYPACSSNAVLGVKARDPPSSLFLSPLLITPDALYTCAHMRFNLPLCSYGDYFPRAHERVRPGTHWLPCLLIRESAVTSQTFLSDVPMGGCSTWRRIHGSIGSTIRCNSSRPFARTNFSQRLSSS